MKLFLSVLIALFAILISHSIAEEVCEEERKMLRILVVGASGGLGKELVKEALSRGHEVSVLIRNKDKLKAELPSNYTSKLNKIYVGDASISNIVKDAVTNKDIVLSGSGSVEPIARTVAEEAVAQGVRKFVYVAGATNVMDEDGVTLNYIRYIKKWPPAKEAYKSHKKCIDAIIKTGINYVIFCPAYMANVGQKSNPLPTPRINRPSGDFVSYEDAAYIMLNAAEESAYDRQLITAKTDR